MNAALSGHALAPTDAWDNPMGTDGFEFIEYAAPDPAAMGRSFEAMGFKPVARHRHKNVLLYRQGTINFLINAEPDSFAQRFARQHGPSVCAIAFRVHDAKAAYERAVSLGAWGYAGKAGPGELNIPAIKGIGDSLIYFVDRWRGKGGAQPGDIGNIGFFDVDFEALPGVSAQEALHPFGHGLTYIDHLTHNVHRGRMGEWADFYERLFNFREVKYFDIEGQVTGVKSKAMTSPCGKIRIPINEEGKENPGQIQEYLDMYNGEGIQHIAMGSDDLYKTVDALRTSGVRLLDTIDTYYELVDKRIPGHGEPLEELHKRKILIDGKKDALLLQIFSENQLGPIFFEFIQRKGDDGFGNGNFKALFESIELDQIRRGVLKAPK
ncbi:MULTISPECIES: 4-hydroxyphenylpyruvate dioxygenase [unclassified Simplicispira]|jgi:4-hydroxyphenylpyruvate dioxygenase|uniref:4-hydroxyphenylpyruvate dioxygenase n=1 Tax=unclassified Simplicispira TaxID=2630407 RepID=UPI000D5F7836|nr:MULTISPECIES: 4-hydroxyphenylpyruvate dioxygenase [unclassified Simplicispira]MBH1979041.1 4-hydroxyphenylpyruvate dioxygenase [Comamonadaceae bacterium]PVY58084.1 4-hydroxyphenylpyruvate dioxygenase [Simplicispira sp. 125]REG19028.1 4-hydroxyphenylpyruvate dioxygenase [Simplicispira sp. 110]